jgi:chemotaxis protein MotB
MFFVVSLIFSFGCVPYWTHQEVANRCRNLEQSIDGHQKEHVALVAEVKKANAERDTYKFDNERLNLVAKANEQTINAYREMAEKFKKGLVENVKATGLPEEEVKVTEEGTISIAGDVLFGSGSADLTRRAKEILAKLAPALKQYEDYYLRIDGHTDNQPIKVSPFKTNFHLGAMRAHAVLMELKNLGIPERTMYIASYSEFRPVVANQDKKGAKENRRVEIAVVKTAR